MKKLTAAVFLSVILVIILIALAFFYIDLSGRKSFYYELFIDGKLSGKLNVDRYVTEDKIIYKAKGDYSHSLGTPSIKEKLILGKKTVLPLKYTKEAGGVKGLIDKTTIEQKGNKTDFLFVSQPQYFFMKDFETGDKTLIFSPNDPMLYMPVMERYNFWKKGAQFFEVMVPLDASVPIVRDKIEVIYAKEEYISIMGRKMEAERYIIRSESLPEANLFLSKYKHHLLSLEIPDRSMKFVLTDTEKTKPLGIAESTTAGSKTIDTGKIGSMTGKEIFFESGGKILSGRLLTPEGKGPFPSVIFVFDDGSLSNAQKSLFDFYAESLLSRGFSVMTFDKPGQGKSQGDITELDDEKRIQNIRDAFNYLKGLPEINPGKIVLMGHEGGGYLALKAAGQIPEVNSCIVLGMPLEYFRKDDFIGSAREKITRVLQENRYDEFEEGYMKRVTEKMSVQTEVIALSEGEDLSFVMGTKVPVKAYREYIVRTPIKAVLAFDRPLLMIFGQNDTDFNAQLVEQLKKELHGKKEERVTIAVFRNLNGYMGKGSKQNSLHGFKASDDALLLAENWLSREEL